MRQTCSALNPSSADFDENRQLNKHFATSSIAPHPFGMQLLVYSAPWCADCREAKRFLDKHGILYQEINIEVTPGAAEEVIRNTGKRAIPQFVIDGRWVQPYRPGRGFLYEEMRGLLGIAEG
jgi:mycoredoxin